MNGKWVTIEGIGGAGKSTQIDRIKSHLENQGYPVVLTREPGGTEVGQQLREILKNHRTPKLSSLSELFLFEADRHETVKQVIHPALREGKIVISDRGIDGTIAYQGFGRQIDLELIENLTNLATEKTLPDLTILIDVPVSTHIQRITQRSEIVEDQFDDEAYSFQEKVREGFLWSAGINPNRIKVVDGSRSVDEVTLEIVDILQKTILNL